MKIKTTITYGDEIVEGLKEAFNCKTDVEVLLAFKAAVLSAFIDEQIDMSEDIQIQYELID
jgi:hypothetical protein